LLWEMPALLGKLFTRLETILGSKPVGAGLLGMVAIGYVAAYLHHPLLPQMNPLLERDGWWTWFDQFTYWQAAAELTQFGLTAENYHYPLGYPLLGALGWKLAASHPFFWPNLLSVVGTAWVCWRIWRLWLNRVTCLAVAVAFVVLHASLLRLTLVVPWNTIPTQLTLLAGVLILLTGSDGRRVVWLAGLAALTYLIRPVDAVCFTPMLVWSVLRLSTWRERLTCGAAGVAVVFAAVLVVGLVNLAVFGNWKSRYEQISLEVVGFGSYPALWQWFWLMVDGGSFFGEADTALLFRYPWVLLFLPGVLWWVRREGISAVIVMLSLLMNWGIYTRYNDFVPSGIFRYSLIHYVTWGFPLMFGLAVVVIGHGWRDRAAQAGLLLTAGLAVLATGLQLEERMLVAPVVPGLVESLPSQRPLWVRFPGEPRTRAAELKLDGQPMQESRDYHMPYVPSDLQVLLGKLASGKRLELPGTQTLPQVGELAWCWRFEPQRWWPQRDYP
jgi:hypothetical protein